MAGSALAGAGGNSVKQDNNLRLAGKSSIYFYDVEATGTHGSGQLVIDLNKHTFLFIGKEFPPDLEINLQARQVENGEYVVFASGKTTPSGNLRVSGVWSANAPPMAVASSISVTYPIYGFHLYNDGLFITKIACYWSMDGATWKESDHTDGITQTHEKQVALKDLGVPDGAYVKIHAIVVGGKDRTGSQVFQCYYDDADYYEGYYCYAYYYIQGVTWNPDLEYEGGRCDPIQ
jgi:hypothetical protein